MTRLTRRLAASIVSSLALALLAGCGDDVDPAASEAALLDQRDRATAELRGLLEGAEKAFETTVVDESGGWDGCESAFPEQFENFRYTADVRLHAAASDPLLPALAALAEDAGWQVEGEVPTVPPGTERAFGIAATKDGLTAYLRDLPPSTQGDVLIEVEADECVDVPRAEREEWLRRDDGGPLPG